MAEPNRTGQDIPRKKKTIREQTTEILRRAEERGVSSNYFFVTTFRRYQKELKILKSLETYINKHGPIIEKEYVKGRPAIVANPAIAEYNKTATAANSTVSTLINIIKSFEDEGENGSKLQDLISSLRDE